MPRPRTLVISLVVVVAALVYPVVRLVDGPSDKPAAAAPPAHDVIANLWEWPWTSIASECHDVLGPAGYGAVQVAPPEDSISVDGHPWWDVYQPAGYDLNSRFGNRAQFVAMVTACHAAGVRVYVDAVINHMTGAGQSDTTSYGGAVFTNDYRYPSAGYTPGDFHGYPEDCPNPDNQISNWNSPQELRECQLSGLSDLRTESEHVRTTIAGYLNDLIDIGVDGFRIDSAKHMDDKDLAAIQAKLHRKVFFFQEVMPGGVSTSEYEPTGSLLEFPYAYAMKSAFNATIGDLNDLEQGTVLDPSDKAVVFVENHDTERDGSTLSYHDGATEQLANVFMLAFTYGTPDVMSSFAFTDRDQAPPSDAQGFVTPVTCGTPWLCQHRARAVRNMVGFHNDAAGTGVRDWWSDGSNTIAFSRGDATSTRAWIAIDNDTTAQPSRTYRTGLPAGTYCDIIHGDVVAGQCSGPTVAVGADGSVTVAVSSKDAVAIDVSSRVGA